MPATTSAGPHRTDCASRLELGAEPNTVQQNGFTPLHEAALRGHVALVRELLRHGANPGVTNAEGHRPLDLARQRGHDEVADLLAAAVPR